MGKRGEAGRTLNERVVLFFFGRLELILFFLVVAVLKLVDQVEDGFDLSLLVFPLSLSHVALYRFEFSELENELGKVWIGQGVPVSYLRRG